MSHVAIAWAWGQELPAAAKMVLLTLADYHIPNQDGAIFPSQSTIAKRAGLSRKHVKALLAQLEADGMISIIERRRDNGGNTSCEYLLHLPDDPVRLEAAIPHGWIYVAAAGGATKVGITRDPESRIKGLQSSNPNPVVMVQRWPGSMRDVRRWEEAILAHFAADLLSGEWLRTPPETVVEHISAYLLNVEGAVTTGDRGGVTAGDRGMSPQVTGAVTSGDTQNFLPESLFPQSPPLNDEPLFAELLTQWPTTRHGGVDKAREAFALLNEADRAVAIRAVKPTLVGTVNLKRRQQPTLQRYLEGRLFEEFDGAPEINSDGRYVITPDRPEWSAWLGAVRSKFGQGGVDQIVKLGRYLPPTRWPEGHPNEAVRTHA